VRCNVVAGVQVYGMAVAVLDKGMKITKLEIFYGARSPWIPPRGPACPAGPRVMLGCPACSGLASVAPRAAAACAPARGQRLREYSVCSAAAEAERWLRRSGARAQTPRTC